MLRRDGRRRTATGTLLSGAVTGAVVAGMLGAAAVVQVASAPEAAAATNPYSITLVARECPPGTNPNVYENVRANRARNNIQETLKNLGPNSNYNDSMNPPVNPVNEAAAPQDVCTPITNWPLTTGSKIDGKSPAPLDYLSKVGGSPQNVYRTLATTPELDAAGNDTGRDIAGAVTVTLSQQQIDLASRNSLWVMGGTRNDPLGEVANGFGPANYAFGALRCSVDALNGDNVEYVGYRNSARHAFCYAIYITPPEPNGTIIVRKEVVGGDSGGVAFDFQGNISYNPGGTFSLKDGESFNERRSAGPWYVQETDLPTGWTLEAIDCSTTGGSTATPNVGTGRVDMVLAGDGTIDCTYRNRVPAPPPTSKLVVLKVTNGSVGAFPFDVTGPNGYADSTTLTTTEEGSPVTSLPDFQPIEAGDYTLTETVPAETADGRWLAPTVLCWDDSGTPSVGAVTGGPTQYSVQVALAAGQEKACVWSNTFEPKADLIIRAKTIGGTDPAINYLTLGYVEASGDCDPTSFLGDQDADTTGDSTGSTWHQAQPAGATQGIPVRTYCIAGTRPTEGADPAWVTKSVVCTGDIDFDKPFNTNTDFTGAIVTPLPQGTVTCDFTYVKRATIDLTKTVTTGNSARTGPVTVSLTCAASAAASPADWPKVLTVATSATSGQLSTQVGAPIYVDGDATGADSCTATETSDGDPVGPDAPPTISPKWKGSAWPSGTRSLVYQQSASVAGATSSNGNPVAVALTSGQCTLTGTALKAKAGKGSCLLTYTTTGNPGDTVVTTTWSVSTPATQGTGDSTGAFAVAAGTSPVAAFGDAYTRPTSPVTTTRTVTLAPADQTTTCRTARTVRKGGTTTVLVCPPTTGQGGKIVVSGTCTPRGLAALGDIVYCRVIVTPKGAVIVKTYGYPVKVTVRASAKAVPPNYKAWSLTRTWYV